MDFHKISVIIPVYNVAPYLTQCLDSLLTQTLKEIEIICVDDGSTDDSLTILQNYAEQDSRIKVLTQKNMGAGIARNRGLAVASGKYLSFLDSDDFFDPQMLEKAYECAERNKAEIVMFRTDRYDHQTGQRYEPPHMMNKDNFPKQDIFTVSDVKNMGINFFFTIYGWTWDKLFLHSFVEKWSLYFQDTRIYNDMFFTYSALCVAERISYMEDILMCQRVNRPGAITKSVQENWPCALKALLYVKNFLITTGKMEFFQQEYATYALHMLLFTLRQLSKGEKSNMEMLCGKYGLYSLGLDLECTDLFLDSKELAEAQERFLNDARVNYYRDEIKRLKKSWSFRIGRFITFIPRKVRGGIRCYKKHGLKYTLRRAKRKLKRLLSSGNR